MEIQKTYKQMTREERGLKLLGVFMETLNLQTL